ncbi:MAG: class I SAM-dependent DNA methyltransferase [Planctomycetota bacterium]|jgi:SAM-dependent methyltransferase
MFETYVDYYDKFYTRKNYEEETDALRELIGRHKRSKANRLLDVACGTGKHLALLREHFDVAGLDISEGMARMARERNPGVEIHVGDMRDFDLGQCFDVILCLFSSIGYLKSAAETTQALRRFKEHLEPGGVIMVEPWFTPEQVRPGRSHMLTVDEPDLKLCRMNTTWIEGGASVIHFHYLIGTPEGTRHMEEEHRMLLLSHEEWDTCFAEAGLDHSLEEKGLMGRGLHIGRA